MIVTCKNCGATVSGRYCSNCSQAAEVHVPSVTELLHEVLEGLTHSDSRLWRSLHYLWLKPGRLTLEFVAGRRFSFLPPFRLYLIISVVFFLLFSLSNPHGHLLALDATNVKGAPSAPVKSPITINIDDCSSAAKELSPEFATRLKRACDATIADKGKGMFHIASSALSKGMFALLPLVAALHMLLYWRPRHRYAEHLVFFLHLQAYFFSVGSLALLAGFAMDRWSSLAPAFGVVATLLLWTMPVYAVLAIRTVFQRSWFNTLIKGAVLGLIYLVIGALAMAGAFTFAFFEQ
jgi:hypothetical protein